MTAATTILVSLLLLAFSSLPVQAFSPSIPSRTAFQKTFHIRDEPKSPRLAATQLCMGKIQSLTPNEAADMGIRDWPQQAKQGQWTESCGEGQTLVRYILDGKGTVEINDDPPKPVAPGTLVEVDGEASLTWSAATELIVLTPGFEEGGKLIAVAGLLIVVCGAALLLGTGF